MRAWHALRHRRDLPAGLFRHFVIVPWCGGRPSASYHRSAETLVPAVLSIPGFQGDTTNQGRRTPFWKPPPTLTGRHSFMRFNPVVGATYKIVPGLTAYGGY